MTLTRKFNTFGGTNINIYLGNKTQKIKLPKENTSLIGGAVLEETAKDKGEEKDKGEGATPIKEKEATPDITSIVANLVSQHADDDEKIDQIETLLTSNWETLYKKLGEIKPDAEYTQKDKSELTKLIQEMVALSLLQTI